LAYEQRGFIKDFGEFLSEHNPSNPDWIESIAVGCLASSLDRNKFIMTKIGPLRMNVFFLMLGPSGLSNKTSPLLYHTIPVLQLLNSMTNRDLMLPSRYSVEGMIEYLSKKQSQGCIIRDEFTSLFKDITNKKYIADGLEFISELYDGYIQKRYTKSAKIEQPKDVFVNFMAATTPYLFTVMNRGFFMQGTGNRFLYIFDNPSSVEESTAEEFLINPYREIDQYEAEFASYARRLQEISSNVPRIIGFMEDAAQLMTKYYNRKRKEAMDLFKKEYLNIDYSYKIRLSEFAIKLAGLHCISYNEERLHEMDELLIWKHNVEWAIKKVNKHWNYYRKMMDVWSSIAHQKEVLSEETELNYVISKLRRLGGCASRSKLRRALGWSNLQKFNSIIGILVDTGEVYIKQGEGSKSGGPKPTVYCLKEF